MTATSAKPLSDEQIEKLAQNYMGANEDDRARMEQEVLMPMVQSGRLNLEKFKNAIARLSPQQEPQQESQTPKQSPKQEASKPVQTTAGQSPQVNQKQLKFAFKAIRGLVLVTNITPYQFILGSLLPQTALAPIYAMVVAVPIGGQLVVLTIAYFLWRGIQELETLKGRDAWWVRGITYAVDAALCIATFPPLRTSISVFLNAGTFADINLLNMGICLFALFAWEILNFVERKVFPGAKFNFWGVV